MFNENAEGLFIKKINRRIAEIRAEKGVTQAELAGRMEVGLRDLQELEAGNSMTLRTIYKFKVALNCSASEFFKEPKTPRQGRGRPKKKKTRVPRGTV